MTLKKKKTEIITIASGKGGTGKTQLAMCLGYMLSQAGLKVLMIDADPGTDGLSHYLLGEGGIKFIKDYTSINTFRGILNNFLETKKIEFEPRRINRNRDHGSFYYAIISGGRQIYGDSEEQASVYVVPPLSIKQFREVIEKIFIDLRKKNYYDYVIVDTRGGFAFESTDICALANSFILVTEADYTSFYQDRNLVNQINTSAMDMKKKTLMRAIIVNKAVEGEEKDFRLTLSKEFNLEFEETYSIPLDLAAIKSYKTHQIPYEAVTDSEFSCATLNAFSDIMQIVTVQWSEDQINKWDLKVGEVFNAYKERQKREEEDSEKQKKREERFKELENKVNYFEKQQEIEMQPKGFFSILLWSIPKQIRPIAVWIFALFILVSVYTVIYDPIRRNLEIKPVHNNNISKIELWEKTDNAAMKSALLELWNGPNDVPDEIWGKALKENSPPILIALAGHPWVSERLKEKLSSDSYDIRVRISGILNRKSRDEVIRKLTKDGDRKVLGVVAANSKTPVEMLSELAKSRDSRVRSAVASNQRTSDSTLRVLGTDKNDLVLRNVASNPITPSEVLLKLAKDKNVNVLFAVASNPQTPLKTSIGILDKFVNNENKEVRIAVANSRKISLDIINKLAIDRSEKVRSAIASNFNTPPGILNVLVKDKNDDVRRNVASNPNTPIDILNDLKIDQLAYVRLAVASNPKTPAEIAQNILTDLSDSQNESVLLAVASNKKTPPSILKKFAKAWNFRVRRNVAQNPNTPIEILHELADDDEISVRSHVASNPNTTKEILMDLAMDKNGQVSREVAINKNTPVKMLKKLAGDIDVETRIGVAKNSLTPFNILKRLAVDHNEMVRIEALSSLISRSESEWKNRSIY
jgi:cellulose biosynthesis protein BcsQ